MFDMSEDGYTRITLRIPDQLHAKLTEAAGRTSKSMNAEIVARLELADEMAAMSEAMRSELDTNRTLTKSMMRMLSMTSFYLVECAKRVPRDSEETKKLMENIELFAAGLHSGDYPASIEPLQVIADMRKDLFTDALDGFKEPDKETRPEGR